MKHNILSYSKQTIDDQDINSVIEVLKSDFLTQGPKLIEFEMRLAKMVGSPLAAAVNSGTAALHTACFAIGLKPDDEVITTPLSFSATANCILYFGARPVFADVDDYGLLNPLKVKEKITEKTRAIITVDYAGQPSHLDQLKKICRQHHLFLIEDAAHSLGATYKNKPIGSLADLTTFSFHPVKTITTAEGGAICTSKKSLHKRLILFRNHGITKEKKDFEKKNHTPWYYEMQHLGFNFRLTDIQAALGISQLSKLTSFIEKRARIAQIYNEAFSNLKNNGILKVPKIKSGVTSAWHLYPLRINFDRLKYSKEEFFSGFLKEGIKLQVHYIPIHLHPYYKKLFGLKRGDFPKAERFYQQEVSLPLYPGLTAKDRDRVIAAVKKYIRNK